MTSDVPIDAEALVRYTRYVEREYRSFIEHVVDLLDAIARVRESVGEAHPRLDAVIRQGISMLLQHGIRPTAQIGDPLDLRFHEVVGVDTTEGRAPDTIVSVVRMGFEVVVGAAPGIRAARVVIAGSQPAGRQHVEGE
jgi:molecular chaperone GrpE (heat shock protein)